MTSIDFLNKVHKSLDSQEYNLSYSPAKSKNYMLYCNGNFIGGLFDEELCFVYADSVSELLGQPEPVYVFLLWERLLVGKWYSSAARGYGCL